MANYRVKLGINFDLSSKQVEILERNKDTIVRALPGSGKTTILTLKIKNLLLDNPHITKICCISYTNINVEDLELSCVQLIEPKLLGKVEFLTFHSFCLQYVLSPFSYLYRNSRGLRPYKKVFNFNEHGAALVDYLKAENIDDLEISKISNSQKVYYNLKLVNEKWAPVSTSHEKKTVAKYLSFLNSHQLIDFNLINLLSLFIIQDNQIVRRALNKSMDWIFIDEFQDVSEIQCKIIEVLSANRINKQAENKWFMVGDPNQSIYGFAGANPRSMYDMRNFFNILHQGEDCEIKLEKSHRCSDEVFKFAKKNYNQVLHKIKSSQVVRALQNSEISGYLDDLGIADDLQGNGGDGKVIVKTTTSAVSDIVRLKLNELLDQEVCCIGINRFNSIDVYKQYMLQDSSGNGENFSLYSEIYKDYEDKYGFKYFSLFIRYLILKHHFYNNRIQYPKSLDKFLYSLKLLISEKLNTETLSQTLFSITVDAIDIFSPLSNDDSIFTEFVSFTERLVASLRPNLKLSEDEQAIFVAISETDKIDSLNGAAEPKMKDFITYITRSNTEKLTFEIKHIHKIKGLEYEQVIVQRVEDLPHKSNYNLHEAVFGTKRHQASMGEIYDYIQELNKLYVMLTRPRKNLYIIRNQSRQCHFLSV